MEDFLIASFLSKGGEVVDFPLIVLTLFHKFSIIVDRSQVAK